MSLNLTYRKYTALITLIVMLWNVGGWLATGLVMNHAHHGYDNFICEVSFCYCETDEAETVCTCHHHDMDSASEHQSDDHDKPGTCYFTKDHTPNTTASQLVFTNSLTAYYFPESAPFYRTTMSYLPSEPISTLLTGSLDDLLRPPQV
ncbi:hypothetical protein [Rhodohalobacter sp. 8-1]|uniref:hypothetical protein n=1 Tax=Rhodohalobacter sp. 8-1 TaxID=3131972 RepID=UPI0030EB3A79